MRHSPRATSSVAWPIGQRGRTESRGGRQQYGGRGYRGIQPKTPIRYTLTAADAQAYGSQNNPFAIQAARDETSFSVVDNTRTSARSRGFGRGGGPSFRGRGQRGGQQQRGQRGTYQRVGGRGQQQNYDRNARGGRGGRRFGGRDDKPQRNRDASIRSVKPDWTLLEEIDFQRLTKLNLDGLEGEDIDSYGFLYYYDRNFDKQPGAKTSERKLAVLERAAYNVAQPRATRSFTSCPRRTRARYSRRTPSCPWSCARRAACTRGIWS